MAIASATDYKPHGGKCGFSHTFDQLTAASTQTDHISVPGILKHKFEVTVADIDTNVTVAVHGSEDGTTFGIAPLDSKCAVTGLTISNNIATITANGTYILTVTDVDLYFLRFAFVGETGGTDATIDVKYRGLS